MDFVFQCQLVLDSFRPRDSGAFCFTYMSMLENEGENTGTPSGKMICLDHTSTTPRCFVAFPYYYRLKTVDIFVFYYVFRDNSNACCCDTKSYEIDAT